MNAIQFIKEHGADKAREVLKAQPKMNSARFRPSDKRYSSTFSSGNTVCTLKLRKLIESIDLIEFCGGIDIAKELDEEFLGENSQAVQQAIADYESIYQCKCVTTRTYENGTCNKCGLQDMGDDSDLEYHVSPLCKIEVK